MTRPDAFPLRDYDLPDGVSRHLEAAVQSVYTDPAMLQAEMRGVFENDWIMVGRAGLIPNPGDYFTCLVGAKPVMVIRQTDGTIAAMGNFCLHRYAKLLEVIEAAVLGVHYIGYSLRDGKLEHMETYLKEKLEESPGDENLLGFMRMAKEAIVHIP